MTSVVLTDWCRFSPTGAAFIEPSAPWENPFRNSFNSGIRDEPLGVEPFSCLTEVEVMVEDFRRDNRHRPLPAHGMTAAAFAEAGGLCTKGRASADRHLLYWLALPDAGANHRVDSPINRQSLTAVGPMSGVR